MSVPLAIRILIPKTERAVESSSTARQKQISSTASASIHTIIRTGPAGDGRTEAP